MLTCLEVSIIIIHNEFFLYKYRKQIPQRESQVLLCETQLSWCGKKNKYFQNLAIVLVPFREEGLFYWVFVFVLLVC